jgi:diamine N-acetyltransferase
MNYSELGYGLFTIRRIKWGSYDYMMNEVYFRDIDHTNEGTVKNIKLKPGQEGFIETVDECLKEAAIFQEWHPVAIYYDEKIIGFAMYGSFGPNRDTWIDRIIIDERYQGKVFEKWQ